MAAPGPLGWSVAGQVDDDEVEGLGGGGEDGLGGRGGAVDSVRKGGSEAVCGA